MLHQRKHQAVDGQDPHGPSDRNIEQIQLVIAPAGIDIRGKRIGGEVLIE